MELLDRYLHAVSFWLPKAQRQDIVQELSGDIQSQIEETERERGGCRRPTGDCGSSAVHRFAIAAR